MNQNKKIIIIIQARTDSQRFPNKVLSLIMKKSLLWHVINRAKQIKYGNVIVATTTRQIDNKIKKIGKNAFFLKKCGFITMTPTMRFLEKKMSFFCMMIFWRFLPIFHFFC